MRALLLASCIVTGLAAEANAYTISNESQPNSTISYFGQYGVQVYGQSFSSLGGTLDSFTFYLSGVTGGTAKFGLATINGSVLGNTIYDSGPFALFNGANTVTSINTSTSSNTTYFAYFTTFGVNNSALAVSFAGAQANTYSAGAFLYGDSVAPGASLSSFRIADTAFTAVFSDATAVPEPASLALLGAGLVGAGLIRRRRSA